jgi:hypothetical protein
MDGLWMNATGSQDEPSKEDGNSLDEENSPSLKRDCS